MERNFKIEALQSACPQRVFTVRGGTWSLGPRFMVGHDRLWISGPPSQPLFWVAFSSSHCCWSWCLWWI